MTQISDRVKQQIIEILDRERWPPLEEETLSYKVASWCVLFAVAGLFVLVVLSVILVNWITGL